MLLIMIPFHLRKKTPHLLIGSILEKSLTYLQKIINQKNFTMKKIFTAMAITGIILYSLKLNSQPSTDWIARYNGPANSDDVARYMHVDNQGNIYVAGTSIGIKSNGRPGSQDYMVVKYSSSGAKLAELRYDGSGTGDDVLNSFCVDDAGTVYTVGRSWGGSNDDFTTVVFNANGTIKWSRRYNGSANLHDFGNDIKIDGDGNVYVTGHINASANYPVSNGNAILTIKYNGSGDVLWSDIYNELPDLFDGSATNREVGFSLALDPASNVYITGVKGVDNVSNPNPNTVITIKYNAAGARVWERFTKGPSSGRKVMIDPAGNIIVAELGAQLTKLTPNGDILWQLDCDLSLRDMEVDAEGNIYIGGTQTQNMSLIKVSTTGAILWTRTYNVNNKSAYGESVALDAYNNVYFTGRITVPAGRNSSVYNYATLAYNSDGNSLWPGAVTYDHTEKLGSSAYAIGTFTAGDVVNVYVSGQSVAKSTKSDWATIKYTHTVNVVSKNNPITPVTSLSIKTYPNPSHDQRTVEFSLPEDMKVTLGLYDINGRLVSTLLNETRIKGIHVYSFASNIPAGNYILSLKGGKELVNTKMTIIE